MCVRYQCIHWYKCEVDELERIFSCTCAVLFYILEYISTLDNTLPDLVLVCIKFLLNEGGGHQARVFQSDEPLATNLTVVGSNPTVGKTFSFCIFTLFVLSSQVDRSHTNEIKHVIHPRY